MKTALTPLLLALTLALFSGDASANNTGSAQFIISVPPSPNATVSRVSVVASADDFPSPHHPVLPVLAEGPPRRHGLLQGGRQ